LGGRRRDRACAPSGPDVGRTSTNVCGRQSGTREMETPIAALAWRVSELERLVGPRPGGDEASAIPLDVPLRASLLLAARAARVAVGDGADSDGPATHALRRAVALRAVAYDADAVLERMTAPETRAMAVELASGLTELVELERVLDRPWVRAEAARSDELRQRIAKVRGMADIVERQVEEETRAVDQLLVAYNAEIARMNLQFEQLVAMLRAVEKKVKPS
jgi:hypothetical protein